MIERLSSADLTQLAVDTGAAPMNIAAVLVLADCAGDDRLPDLLAARLAQVPRLRQRLLRPPAGCGRPVWVDDPSFTVAEHLHRVALAGGGRPSLWQAAADIACTRLPDDRPPWSATWITGWDDGGRAALVVAAHHVLADGLGALQVLASLADPGPPPGDPAVRPAPTTRELAADAARARLHAVAGLPRACIAGLLGLRELGLRAGRPTTAARTSLTRPTGARRRLAVVDVALADVIVRAHRLGGTLNDVVVSAVVGALAAVLADRGEHPAEIVVSVPVTSRRPGAAALGNHTGAMPVAVPVALDPDDRVRAVALATAARRGAVRGASAGPLGASFRLLARFGLFLRFVEHQRLVHTFETNMRGPSHLLSVGGHRIEQILPLAINPGNVAVSFATLSYAGRLAISVICDPDHVAQEDQIARVLTAGLVDP